VITPDCYTRHWKVIVFCTFGIYLGTLPLLHSVAIVVVTLRYLFYFIFHIVTLVLLTCYNPYKPVRFAHATFFACVLLHFTFLYARVRLPLRFALLRFMLLYVRV